MRSIRWKHLNFFSSVYKNPVYTRISSAVGMFYTSNAKNNPLTALLLHDTNNNVLALDYLMSGVVHAMC